MLVKIRLRYDGERSLWILCIITANYLTLTYSSLFQPSSSNKQSSGLTGQPFLTDSPSFILPLRPLREADRLFFFFSPFYSRDSVMPVKFTWKKLHLGKWLLIWAKSSLWRNRLALISCLLVAENALLKESVCCLFKILIYDLKRERNVFVYVFCFVVFVVCFFSTSIPVTFIRGLGGTPYFETLLETPLLLLQLIIHLLSVIICRWPRLNRFLARFMTSWN